MAKTKKMNTSNKTPRDTNNKNNTSRSKRRSNPLIPKAGVTRSGRRSFKNGGKLD